MSALHWNAHDITRTRLCAAHECPHDAETGWALCRACERLRAAGVSIKLHATPAPLEPTLRCSECNTYKPDRDFPLRPTTGRSSGGRDGDRRGRYFRCNDCGGLR